MTDKRQAFETALGAFVAQQIEQGNIEGGMARISPRTAIVLFAFTDAADDTSKADSDKSAADATADILRKLSTNGRAN